VRNHVPALLLIFCVCRKTLESAIVDYKKDKRIREREKARVTQLYETVPQEAIDDSALIVENDPYCQIRHNSKFGPTLQLPQYRASIGPGEENKFDALNVQSRNFRSHSEGEPSMTVHDLRKQSVNLLSPVKQLRRGTISNSGRSLGGGEGASSDIIRLENPEKRLSIRPLMTTAPPLPTFTEGSEHSEPRKRIFSNVELERILKFRINIIK